GFAGVYKRGLQQKLLQLFIYFFDSNSKNSEWLPFRMLCPRFKMWLSDNVRSRPMNHDICLFKSLVNFLIVGISIFIHFPLYYLHIWEMFMEEFIDRLARAFFPHDNICIGKICI